MTGEVEGLIEDEWYIVRHSGETPEIAFNSAIYFLTRSAEGPGIDLDQSVINSLKAAATERYREIVLRDLDHNNTHKPIYRGLARSICNYQRFCNFCSRQQVDPGPVKTLAGEALEGFLQRQYQLLQESDNPPPINCSFTEVRDYARELGVGFGAEYARLEQLCEDGEAG